MNSLTGLSLSNVVLKPGWALALVMNHPSASNSEQREIREATLASLRLVLTKLTSRPPESFRFETTASGKPHLADNFPIAFNLSHSRSHSLIALSMGEDIGCDIEDRFRPDDDVDELGAMVLHPAEQQEMGRLAAPDREKAFKRYWVRKEAVLKAAGSGFLQDPRTVIVGLDRAQPAWTGADGPVLNLHEMQLAEDCFAAVASADPACSWHLLAP